MDYYDINWIQIKVFRCFDMKQIYMTNIDMILIDIKNKYKKYSSIFVVSKI